MPAAEILSPPDESSAAREPFVSVELPPSYGALREKLLGYLPSAEVERIDDAARFAAWSHQGQKRASGEPYVTHPIAVASLVADWKLDASAIAAALLHDVMEDAHIRKSELAHRFGPVTAELVDGLTKIERLESQSLEDNQAENFRKMLLAMARDLRVILIKLADRTHNMRTLGAVAPAKRRRIAQETLEIYAPIANRLGLNTLYRELQDLAFQHRHPWRYAVLAHSVEAALGTRDELLDKIRTLIERQLVVWGVDAQISSRRKHLYSIYQKMRSKHLRFEQILDLFGFRVVVPDEKSCYLAIGALHAAFKPVPGKFKDYLALPKPNGYQSLHTTVIGPQGIPVEIQVRTQTQHRLAEDGVAAHWIYKDAGERVDAFERQTHAWLQSLVQLQSNDPEARDFLESFKIDLYPDEVFVFSPRGEIFALPRGATPVDFAYAIHTDVGHRCIACRINGELMPLRTELANGDRVEIITSSYPSPNPAWLNYVRTAKARAEIRHFLRHQKNEQAVSLGERLLDQALRPRGLTLGQISVFAWDRLLRQHTGRNKKQLLEDIGLGHLNPAQIAEELTHAQDLESGRPGVLKPRASGPVLIRGDEGQAVVFGRCCHPLPGDPIVGLLSKGHGLEIHRHDCPRLRRQGGDRRWIDVDWDPNRPETTRFEVGLRVLARDAVGMLARITAAIAAEHGHILAVQMEAHQGLYLAISFTLQVADRIHLARIMRAIRRVPEVVRLQRGFDAQGSTPRAEP